MFSGDLVELKIIYTTLWTINIFIFWKYGLKMSKYSEKKYWHFALLPILSYGVFMGLRFGRMIDYNYYCERYYALANDINAEDYEPLFKWICHYLGQIGIPYYIFILLCDVFLIITLLAFLKDYRKAMPFMLIIFLNECNLVENYIRWYLGVAFFLIYMYNIGQNEMTKANIVNAIISAICASSIHVGFVFLSIVFCAIRFIKFQLIPTKLCSLLFLFSLIFGSASILIYLEPYLSLLGIDERSSIYIDKFQNIISGEFGTLGIKEWSYFRIFRQFVAYSFGLYFLKRIVNYNKVSYMDINCFSIGLIIFPIFKQVEILDRFSSVFTLYSIIILGSSYTYAMNNFRHLKQFEKLYFVVSMMFYFWPMLDNFRYRDWYNLMYIWDANGLEKLPVIYFLN